MKKCKVLSYNPHRQVLVFEYDNKKIQAHFHMDEVLEYVYATYAENGLYEISTKNIITVSYTHLTLPTICSV